MAQCYCCEGIRHISTDRLPRRIHVGKTQRADLPRAQGFRVGRLPLEGSVRTAFKWRGKAVELNVLQCNILGPAVSLASPAPHSVIPRRPIQIKLHFKALLSSHASWAYSEPLSSNCGIMHFVNYFILLLPHHTEKPSHCSLISDLYLTQIISYLINHGLQSQLHLVLHH